MLVGNGPVDEFLAHVATLDDFDTEAVTAAGDVEMLQVTFEIRIDGRQASLPTGLHPTNPPTFIVQLWRCGESPWGPFRWRRRASDPAVGYALADSCRAASATTMRPPMRCDVVGAFRCSAAASCYVGGTTPRTAQ